MEGGGPLEIALFVFCQPDRWRGWGMPCGGNRRDRGQVPSLPLGISARGSDAALTPQLRLRRFHRFAMQAASLRMTGLGRGDSEGAKEVREETYSADDGSGEEAGGDPEDPATSHQCDPG